MKNQYILLSIFSLLIAFVLLPFYKIEIPVMADGAGASLGIIPNGSFNVGINMTPIAEPQNYSQTSTWTYSELTDYISFRDSTTVPGFRLNVIMSSTAGGDFVYTGGSASQTAIDVSNFKIWANYFSGTYLSATSGIDDDTKNLNVLSAGSCGSATDLGHYAFNDAFGNSATDFGLTMSATALNYFNSDLSCEVEGKLDIRRFELVYPPSSNAGSYDSTMMLVIIDGIN